MGTDSGSVRRLMALSEAGCGMQNGEAAADGADVCLVVRALTAEGAAGAGFVVLLVQALLLADTRVLSRRCSRLVLYAQVAMSDWTLIVGDCMSMCSERVRRIRHMRPSLSASQLSSDCLRLTCTLQVQRPEPTG
jgi:hypothetical protein